MMPVRAEDQLASSNRITLMHKQDGKSKMNNHGECGGLGIELVHGNPKALLIFSGGATRSEVGPLSEGAAYWKVVESCANSHFEHFAEMKALAFSEDYAIDSVQNLLFCICHFREITAISLSYKKTRFEKLHRKAPGFPEDIFTFLGVDGEPQARSTSRTRRGSSVRMAIELFKQDLFGCHLKLKDTRVARNPYFRSLPYPRQCPELNELFNICADAQGLDELNLKLPCT